MKKGFNLFNYLKMEHFKKIVISVGEVGLDHASHNELIQSIPVLRSISDTLDLIDSIRNRHLLIKLSIFFEKLYSIPLEVRSRFIDKHAKSQKNLSQQIIIYLDRQEANEKAVILSNIFTAFLYEKIDYTVLVRLLSILDKVIFEDLTILKNEFIRQLEYPIEGTQKVWLLGKDYEHLVATGMVIENTGFGLNPGQVNLSDFGLEGEIYEHSQFYITHLGTKLIKHGLLEKSGLEV